jgi:hypothetical protein
MVRAGASNTSCSRFESCLARQFKGTAMVILIDILGLFAAIAAIWFFFPILKLFYKDIRKVYGEKE